MRLHAQIIIIIIIIIIINQQQQHSSSVSGCCGSKRSACVADQNRGLYATSSLHRRSYFDSKQKSVNRAGREDGSLLAALTQQTYSHCRTADFGVQKVFASIYTLKEE
jgi:hypothetical protein